MDPSLKFAAKAMGVLQEEGVILRALPVDGIGFCPPLIITEDEINMMFDRVEKAMPKIDAMAKDMSAS